MSTADLLCSPSVDMSNFVAGITGLPAGSIVTSLNPVDTERFSPDGERFQAFGRPTALLVGRLEKRKGVDLLIEAVPIVVREVPDAHFLIIGADTNTGPDGGSMLKHLKQRLAESGCQQHVTFMSQISIERMPEIYRSADICVIPSLYDNAPYSCIEAMACGLPVVASDAGGTKEYISQGEWGFVVPTGSVAGFANAVACLLKDSPLRQRFGCAARSYVTQHLSRPVIAEQMEELYGTAMKRWNLRQPLYQKSPAQSLPAAVQLACAFDTALFETICSQSFDFSLRHQMRFAVKRPKLFVASALTRMLTLITRFCPLPLFKILQKRLEASLAAKQNVARYERAQSALLLQAAQPSLEISARR